MNVPAPSSAPASPPSLLDEPMSPQQILFGLQGRIPRRTFWLWGVLGVVIGASVLLELLLGIAGVDEELRSGLASLLLLWPTIAISVKRWHDRDKSGWWVLINLIPVAGVIWSLVENGFLRGSVGPNRFGDDLTGRI
jgi:uncharacterized membrane protein YhaH (DUF805 family)